MNENERVDMARQLFDAFASGDEEAVRRLCSAGLIAVQNYGKPMDLDALVRFTLSVSALVPDFHYEDAIRTATTEGFIEEHRVCGTLPDGTALNMSACVVAEVADGQIARLRETVDGYAAMPLIKALSKAR